MLKNSENFRARITEKSLYLLFSHHLTAEQQQNANLAFGVTRFEIPPDNIQTIWSQIPPDAESIAPLLLPVKTWLEQHAVKGDLVLIQGDFGATVLMVNYALSLGLTPIYATTQRQAREKMLSDGRVETHHVFSFTRFRIYGQ